MKRSSIEAVLADKWDEAGLTDRCRTNLPALGSATHQGERLGALCAQWNDHPAPRCELLDERRRYLGPTRCNQDRVVGRVGAPPQRSVADQHGDVADARSAERRLCRLSERSHAFDRKDLVRERREQRCLIPLPGADLEDAFFPLEAQGLEIAGLREGLRNRLTASGGERGVLVGAMAHRFGHEQMAWRRRKGP